MALLEAKQAERRFGVTCPALEDDVLLFRSMNASEHLSRPFEFDLELLSKDAEIKLEDVLGQAMTIRLDLPDGSDSRYFNGFVSQFCYLGTMGNYARYRAELRPWLWLLTRRADCRIFQDMEASEIIDQVFRDAGFSDFELKLFGEYRKFEYCVQYRETDFNFVSRLMEQEGIYYFFEHKDGLHTLVLADSVSAHERIPGYEQVPYYPPGQAVHTDSEYISDWLVYQQAQPGKYTLRDFQFAFPSEDLKVEKKDPREHDHAEYEVYDYPGVYVAEGTSGPEEAVKEIRDHGEVYAQIRLEELHSQYERAQGQGELSGICAGGLFELTKYEWRQDQNREYLVVSSSLDAKSDVFESGGGETTCHCSFTAIDSKRPYRAPRVTPKPVVQGPQTAIVTGPGGEEIWTDAHGRVKVKFHWDRINEKDETSSCWVRVSHPWAGKGWGAVSIPRIDQEVVVDFLEGDPDRPIVTGRVYNAETTPPYSLPGEAMLSGIKSNSTKGGGGYNEYVMDDTKGNELIREHGQFDKDSTIENDLREHVLNNRSRDVAVDETIEIGNDQTYSVGNNQTRTVGVNKSTEVGTDHTETIGSNMSVNVGSNLSETVGSNYTETVGIAMALTVGAAMAQTVGVTLVQSVGTSKTETIGTSKSVTIGTDKTENVGANNSVSIGSDKSEDVGGSKTVKVKKDLTETVEGQHVEQVTKDYALKAKKIIIEAEDEISIQTGKAIIEMKKNGDITINGKKITVKGSGDVIVKGSKVLQN